MKQGRVSKSHKAMAQLGTLALVAGGFTAIAVAPAQADTGTAGFSYPTVVVGANSQTITPAASQAGTLLAIPIAATDVDGESELDNVTMCLYLDGTGDPDCASGNLNPANTIRMTWTNNGANSGTGGFALAATNGDDGDDTAWRLGTGGNVPTSDYDATGNTTSLVFKANPSQVMREASSGTWKARSVASANSLTGTGNSTGSFTMSVAHYSAITANRSAQGYGTINSGSSANANAVSSGTLMSNGTSSLTYALGGTFAGGLTNANTTPASAPAFGETAFDCTTDSTYSNTAAVRITTTPATVATGLTTTGTSESPSALPGSQSCRLSYGGGLVAGDALSATVTVASS